MSETLTFNDNVRRVGYTTIDGVRVVQYDCTLPSDNPEGMRIVVSKLDLDMYKTHRTICRADQAEFEDACYVMQDEYIAKMAVEEPESTEPVE